MDEAKSVFEPVHEVALAKRLDSWERSVRTGGCQTTSLYDDARFPHRLQHWRNALWRPSARQLLSSAEPGERWCASHPATTSEQTRLPVWAVSFRQGGNVNTHIQRHTHPHMQKEPRTHGRVGIFPRSHTRVHLLSHTHILSYQRKTRVYSLICYRIQGVTLISICMWSATECRA